MTRIASIWLPQLAIERWAKSSDSAPESPVVLTVDGPHGPMIHAVTQAAAARGARPGARLTDARALDPALVAVAADPEGDSALLDQLARWVGRWSPVAEVDGPDGLRLDADGVAHLFGGEDGLASDIERRFAGLGLTARVAIAPTAAAAWALARFGGDSLEPLPAAALRLEPDTVRTLERLGLKSIGALIAVPRLALARRFKGAENVVDALDRMVGKKPEPLTAARTDPPPRASLRLEEPATHPEAASHALGALIPELVRQLEQRHLGARRLTLTGYCVDGSTSQASVATAIPSREGKHLQRLLADKVAALDPGFGVDAFALTADWTEALGAAQASLVEEPSGERDIARLIDRLSVKLGPSAVRRPQSRQSHLPEKASGWVAAISSPAFAGEDERVRTAPSSPAAAHREARRRGPSTSSAAPPPLEIEGRKVRPHHLLDRPEAIDVIYATPEGMPRRFVWRRAVHDIARAQGPERISPEWWLQPGSARLRDYYRVEDADGRRYWIFREGIAGDGRGGAPAWFIHGLFG
jgi:protein ImuB